MGLVDDFLTRLIKGQPSRDTNVRSVGPLNQETRWKVTGISQCIVLAGETMKLFITLLMKNLIQKKKQENLLLEVEALC